MIFRAGVMSGIIGADNRFGEDFGHPDAAMQGNITALYDIGCVLGSIVCYFVGERLGRRAMLMMGGCIMMVGTAILGSSFTTAQLIVGRIVTGVGNGMNSSTAPVYQSECAPAGIRGALLTLQGTVTILGVVIAYWADYGTASYASSFQWRFPLSFQAFFAVCLVLQVVGLPETPRWLAAHDRHEEARGVVAAILDRPEDDPAVSRVLLDIQSGLEEEQREGPFRFAELFTWGKTQNLRRMLITISVQLGQQFTGSNMINYYMPTIFENRMGMSRDMSLILSGCAEVTYLVGSAIPVFLMDRFGRRILLMVCSAGLCLCFVMVSILLSSGDQNLAYGATAFIFLFQLFYGIGWLPVRSSPAPCIYHPQRTDRISPLARFPGSTRPRSTRRESGPRCSPSPRAGTGWPCLPWSRSPPSPSVSPCPALPSRTLFPYIYAHMGGWLIDLAPGDREHRVAHLHHLRGTECPLHPHGLFLLPGDQGPGARGHPAAVRARRHHGRGLLDRWPNRHPGSARPGGPHRREAAAAAGTGRRCRPGREGGLEEWSGAVGVVYRPDRLVRFRCFFAMAQKHLGFSVYRYWSSSVCVVLNSQVSLNMRGEIQRAIFPLLLPNCSIIFAHIEQGSRATDTRKRYGTVDVDSNRHIFIVRRGDETKIVFVSAFSLLVLSLPSRSQNPALITRV